MRQLLTSLYVRRPQVYQNASFHLTNQVAVCIHCCILQKSLCSSPVRTTKFNSKSSPQHTKKLGSSPLPSPTEANDPWILRHTSDPHIQQRIRKLEEFERNFTIVLRTMNETMKKGEQRIVASEHKEFIKREWQQVALVVDRLLLFLFVLVTVGVTLGLLLRGTISYAMASPMLPAKSAI